MSWPASWKSYLASGGVASVNPLLVGQDGTDYTNGDFTPIWSNKAKEWLSQVYDVDTTDGIAWSSDTNNRLNSVSNRRTSPWLLNTVPNACAVSNYISYNKPYVQLDPQKITKVTPKSIATNSHSVYKDSLITWLATDKIAVGNGSNGYESKVLENDSLWSKENGYVVKFGDSITISPNEDVLLVGFEVTLDGITYVNPTRFKRVSNSLYNVVLLQSFTMNTSDWDLVETYPTPQHLTHTLDNSNSSACKYFEVDFEFSDGSKGEGVITQEMVWDYSADRGGDFTTITTSTDLGTLNVNEIYQVTTEGVYRGYFRILSNSIAQPLTNQSFSLNTKGQIVWAGVDVIAERFDGNGFGDTNQYDQLTNGTDIDLNGNTIKTGFFGRRK